MKQAGGETLYLKVDRNVQVHDKKVTIGDLAQILCTCLLYTSPSPRDA